MEETSSNENENFTGIENWSKDEKYYLYKALQLHHYQDTVKIQEYIQSKSLNEVESAISYYKRELMNNPVYSSRLKNSNKTSKKLHGLPLSDWAKYLVNSYSLNDLYTDTATAVSVIANNEEFPHPVCTDNIDFKNVYNTIASVMDGKAVAYDKYTFSVIDKCLYDTALNSKCFRNKETVKAILSTIDVLDKPICTFTRPTDDTELAIIRHLTSQRMYNPLNFSEDYLKLCGTQCSPK